MRRLKTLNDDASARAAVGRAASKSQSGDMMDFGLLCYEMGRDSLAALRVKVAAQKRTIRRLRKALTVARNRFKSMEMGTFIDECSAALKPRAKR